MDASPALRRAAALPIWRALLALLAGGVTMALLRLLPGTGGWPPMGWALVAGAGATLAGLALGLGRGWRLFTALTPLALAWQLEPSVPVWIWLVLLGVTLLVFGGGVLTRVPLYNSNIEAWETLGGLLPGTPGTLVDLGAGLGGPLAHLSRVHPAWQFRGVEASPLVWLVAWLRCRRRNCRIRLGSLWQEELREVDVVYAFLSPAPMPDLWAKVLREMRPGTLLVSHSFEVPGVVPERTLPLRGRPGACLRLYRVP